MDKITTALDTLFKNPILLDAIHPLDFYSACFCTRCIYSDNWHIPCKIPCDNIAVMNKTHMTGNGLLSCRGC